MRFKENGINMRAYFNYLLPIVLAFAVAPVLAAADDGAFHPGQFWPDDKGVHINAHGGGVLLHKGTYYWYGEHKVGGDAGNSAYVGIHVYSSKNLSAWKDEGIALPVSDDTTHDLSKGSIIERPKVIYNKKTRKFVMWFHLDYKGLGYKSSRSGVAISNSPLGPFTYVDSFLPNGGVWPLNIREEEKDPSKHLIARDHDGGQFARDMTLFVDDDDKAYHVYASEDNHTLHVSMLSDDYTRPSGRYARVLEGGDNEAPVVFKTRGKYYLIASGLSGWAPNAARSYVASSLFGPWTSLGNPVRGTEAQMETTFGGQGTHIIPYKGGFIFMADIWRPQNAIDGRYAWLPLAWEDGKPVLRWQDSWRIDQASPKTK